MRDLCWPVCSLKRSWRRGLWRLVTLGVIVPLTQADNFVPFTIPGTPNPDSLIAIAAEPITTRTPRVTTDGEHFMQADQRLRIWGVNTSFNGNLPTHSEAERMARRLAAMGVNCVRLHHMDTSRWPSGLWDPTDGVTLYAPALERLDYYIDQLAQNGIWCNLNLHVGRKHSDYLAIPASNSDYDKVVDLFTPQIIAAQKDYADQMLNHVNQYRGVRYADDPAVAFVEISNEDSFFMWDGEQRLRNLPDFYADLLRTQYNAWLLSKYDDKSGLETAWSAGLEPLGDDLLTNGDFQTAGGSFPQNWTLEQHETSTATWNLTNYAGKDCLQLNVTNDDGTGWHLQFNQRNLPIDQGRFYTLTFDAAASGDRTLQATIMQAHEPWEWLGLGNNVSLTTDWQSFQLGFFATGDDNNARVNFAFGGASETVYITNVKLRPGGQMGLLPGEDPSAGTVAFFVDGPGTPREMDRLRFLTETEKAYFDDLRTYVKDTLNCDALVTGTIVFGPLGLYAQQDMDFIDSHAYWHHPTFPGGGWDSVNWFVEQEAMTDRPSGATFRALAANRLAGKPYTVSEYNHPAPNDYQAECVPMLASFAAAQDWDGIWLYSYTHAASNWDAGIFNSFFDIDHNPGKWGFMRAGAAMFRDGGVGALGHAETVSLVTDSDALSDAVSLRINHGDSVWGAVQGLVGVPWQDLLTKQLKVSFASSASDSGESATSLAWQVPATHGQFTTRGQGAWCFTGWADQFSDPNTLLTFTTPQFAAVTVTALDASTLIASNQILVTACGRSENTDMGFSADRRTVGNNWGTPPVRIEAVDGALRLPAGRWKAQRLTADGAAAGVVPTSYALGYGQLTMNPAFGTLWYLLAREIGDLDNDGDVDFADASFLSDGCLTGPNVSMTTNCERLDLSGDNDLDGEDVAAFQRNFTGTP